MNLLLGRVSLRLIISLGVALGMSLLMLGLFSLRTLDALQLVVGDLLFKSRPVERNARFVAVVGMDETTFRELREFGRHFTWPRTFHAEVVRNLKRAEARVIVFDILFEAPAPGDDELAEALREAGNVISPVALDPGTGLPLIPLKAFVEASAGLGSAVQDPDEDGTIRKVPLLVQLEGETYPAMALAAAAHHLRRPRDAFIQPEGRYASFVGRAIPLDQQTLAMRINYLGRPIEGPRNDVVPMISFVDVMRGQFDPALVRNKVVFIGTTALALADDYWVPTATKSKMDGVEIHAHAAETILRGEFVEDAPRLLTAGLIVLFGLLVGVSLVVFGPLWGAVASLALAFLYAGASVFAFDSYGTMLNVIYPLVAVFLAFAGVALYQVVFEQRGQRVLKAAFAQYVPPAVAAEVAKNPDAVKLGGEKRPISVLFTDLQEFTAFSESVSPEVLSSIINAYLTAMTEAVYRYEGTVDKFIGDAVMAFWNAPLTQVDHARRACLAAIEMQADLARLGDGWEKQGLPRHYMRIGINTGEVAVGNMGSKGRLAYTALGDSVNLGARLEPLNKDYGTWIAISDFTRQAAGNSFALRYLDVVAVKGKTEPVAVYELLGEEGKLPDQKLKVVELYQKAMELYLQRQWRDAVAAFARVLELDPTDGPSRAYLDRCQDLVETPPPKEWDGVYVMTHK